MKQSGFLQIEVRRHIFFNFALYLLRKSTYLQKMGWNKKTKRAQTGHTNFLLPKNRF